MKLKILDQAEADLIEGFHFYETQQTGIGGGSVIQQPHLPFPAGESSLPLP